MGQMGITKIALIAVLVTVCTEPVLAKSIDLSNDQAPSVPRRSISSEGRDFRLVHAKELLGRYYDLSAARTGEQISKINEMIYRWTAHNLPKKHRKNYMKIAQTIIDQAHKYEFDPVFIMSIIHRESSFNPETKGGFGEIGLMQIKPSTAKWIAAKYKLKYKNKKTLSDPVSNIKLGAAYLDYLRAKFDSHARLYLAAYNMGQGNVKKALGKKVWPKDYPGMVMQHYIDYYTQLRQWLEASAPAKEG